MENHGKIMELCFWISVGTLNSDPFIFVFSWFVRAMEMELEQEEEQVSITTLSPYQVKQLLISILIKHPEEYDFRLPLQRRQIDGALSRVPKDFYERVWEILERTPGGIKVAGYLLPQVLNLPFFSHKAPTITAAVSQLWLVNSFCLLIFLSSLYKRCFMFIWTNLKMPLLIYFSL